MGKLLDKLNMKNTEKMEPGQIYFILENYRIFEGKNPDPKTGELMKGVSVETDKGSRYLPNTIAVEIIDDESQFEVLKHRYVRCTEFRNKFGTMSKSLELLSDDEIAILFGSEAPDLSDN